MNTVCFARRFVGFAIAAVLISTPCLGAGATSVTDSQELQIEEKLFALRAALDNAQTLWEESIDDPVSDELLKKSYQALQDVCHELYRRRGGFGTAKQKEACEIAQYPYEMYYNELIIKVNNLKKQLFEIETPGTVANDYYRRPSKDNLDKLRNIFERVNKYYVGAPYTWNRYYNKYLFSRSRLDQARKIWDARSSEYKAALQGNGEAKDLEVVRKRAESAFRALKEEAQKNNLPFCGKVNAFYLAQNLEGFMEKEKEWSQIELARKQAGRSKEVAIFIHGMGEDRNSWRKFPVLLAREDLQDSSMDRWFSVYVFRYDTVEDSKSVEGFRRELTGFIKDILKEEQVPHVNLVGHSLGGVIALKYLVQYVDEQTKNDKVPPTLTPAPPSKDIPVGEPIKGSPLSLKGGGQQFQAHAKKLLKGYLNGRYRRPVARFVGIAPSLSGSEVANVMAGIFKRDPPLYERSLGPFQSGIPIAGDLQVLENQIGSRVNLNSFTRLVFERPLDPYAMLDFLPDQERADISAQQMEKLHEIQVKTLTLIGKQPIVIPLLGHAEEDGLVKCYSANLNHIFMADGNAKSDVGYKSGEARYIQMGHNQLIEVEDRNHPSYEYVVSFLCDKLIPQKNFEVSKVKHFICMLRTYPGNFDADEYPEFCFYPEERTYFTKEERYELPALSVRTLNGWEGSSNVRIHKSSWNPFTGVYYVEGEQRSQDAPAWVSLELAAPGFQNKVLNIPVSGGLVTYAVRLQLDPHPNPLPKGEGI